LRTIAEVLSVALEEPVADAAKRAARRRGISLSAWPNERQERFGGRGWAIAVAEWEAEHGTLPGEALTVADAAWPRARDRT
jgi:hypothetical protein